MEEFIVAAGGPVFGVTSLPPLALHVWTGEGKWVGYASVLAFVNLFNLLPIGILDGGRILRSVVSSINSRTGDIAFILSLGLGALLVWQLGILTLGIILMLSAFEFLSERKFQAGPPTPGYDTGTAGRSGCDLSGALGGTYRVHRGCKCGV